MEYVVNQRRRAAEKYTASATRASPRSKRHPTPRISQSVPRMPWRNGPGLEEQAEFADTLAQDAEEIFMEKVDNT